MTPMINIHLQYAHHAHDEFEEFQSVNKLQVLEQFDRFDWDTETQRAEQLQKVSPTLSVVNDDKSLLLWVSAIKEDNQLIFISECHFPGEVTSLFGLIRRRGTISLGTQNFSQRQARQALSLFVDQSFESLRELYKKATC